jgi:hypothetical protein
MQDAASAATAKLREQKRAQLNEERDVVVADMRNLVLSCTNADIVRQREALVSEVFQLTAAVEELQEASGMPLAERLQALLVGQVASLQGIMRDEVKALEERSAERLSQAKTEAEAAAKVRNACYPWPVCCPL